MPVYLIALIRDYYFVPQRHSGYRQNYNLFRYKGVCLHNNSHQYRKGHYFYSFYNLIHHNLLKGSYYNPLKTLTMIIQFQYMFDYILVKHVFL